MCFVATSAQLPDFSEKVSPLDRGTLVTSKEARTHFSALLRSLTVPEAPGKLDCFGKMQSVLHCGIRSFQQALHSHHVCCVERRTGDATLIHCGKAASGLRQLPWRSRLRRCDVITAAERPWRFRGQTCDLSARPRSTALPYVDWRRYHLNLLFVDSSDTVRARVAAGLFERISEWNGYGRVLLASTAGVHAIDGQPPDASTTMALLAQAGRLGIRPKLFTSLPERFEADDFYRYDTIVALDEDVRQRLLEIAHTENATDAEWYTQRVCSLGAFSFYCGADQLTKKGGTALLQRELGRVLLPTLPAARAAGDIRRPDLMAGPEDWNAFIAAVLVATAGLFQYVADEYPSDLPEYDPV